MRATVSIDDHLLRTAQEYSGVTERTALFRLALEALIAREAAHRLALLGGTMPDFPKIPRRRSEQR